VELQDYLYKSAKICHVISAAEYLYRRKKGERDTQTDGVEVGWKGGEGEREKQLPHTPP